MKPRLSKGKMFLLLVLALIAARWFFTRAPSEKQMVAKFHAHKTEFEQIRLMMKEDNLASIGPDSASAQPRQVPGNGFIGLEPMPLKTLPSRLALYRSRLKALGFDRASFDSIRNQVRFVQFGGGFTDTVWNIGYIWCKNTPKPLVQSAYHQMPGQNHTHFTRIEGDWYIYHSR